MKHIFFLILLFIISGCVVTLPSVDDLQSLETMPTEQIRSIASQYATYTKKKDFEVMYAELVLRGAARPKFKSNVYKKKPVAGMTKSEVMATFWQPTPEYIYYQENRHGKVVIWQFGEPSLLPNISPFPVTVMFNAEGIVISVHH